MRVTVMIKRCSRKSHSYSNRLDGKEWKGQQMLLVWSVIPSLLSLCSDKLMPLVRKRVIHLLPLYLYWTGKCNKIVNKQAFEDWFVRKSANAN
jgi:hypothetical protein